MPSLLYILFIYLFIIYYISIPSLLYIYLLLFIFYLFFIYLLFTTYLRHLQLEFPCSLLLSKEQVTSPPEDSVRYTETWYRYVINKVSLIHVHLLEDAKILRSRLP